MRGCSLQPASQKEFRRLFPAWGGDVPDVPIVPDVGMYLFPAYAGAVKSYAQIRLQALAE